VGGVRHGAGPAEVDGDSFGARLPEPVREPRRTVVPGGARLPQPLRARRHRPVEHRQHLGAHQAVKRVALALLTSYAAAATRPRAYQLPGGSRDDGERIDGGLILRWYVVVGGRRPARAGKAGEGSRLIHTAPRDPRHTWRGR
jgi:hypothetical protein